MSNSNTNSPSGTGTGTGTGTTPSHANPLDLEEEDYTTFQDLDSDSEGGMQLDPPELTFHLAGSEIQYDTHAWEETRDGKPSLFPFSDLFYKTEKIVLS